MKIKKFKSVLILPAVLILIELVLFIANYKPGTYLIGWDNIMPEFDLKLNFVRSFFSIWQEYRGLGVTDGLSHAANLFHTIYIFLLSLALPQSVLRYAFIHLTHVLGGIGFFFLARKLTKNDKASFIGALFYMFNLGIIQMYFAPLEVFATHFAALPIIALFATNALENPSRKNLLLLFLSSLLLSQQGFVPTVFIAFGIFFFFLLLVNFFKYGFKRVFQVFLMVFLANAFWGLPYVFSALHTGVQIADSRINQFSSEEIFYRNKTFGDIPSVLSLKGFMIDTIELNTKNLKDVYFMDIWRNLASTFFYNAVYLVFFVLSILGTVLTIFKRKSDYLPYLLTAVVAFFFLANDAPVLSNINEAIRSHFPLIGEAFRFPFTKFITVFAFSLSVLLTFGLSWLMKKLKFQTLVFVVFSALILFIAFPAFTGNFTSPFLKQQLPQDYLSLFKEMQSLGPDQRVALFPVQTFWNWQYRSWGQRGSGFIWHGLPQPIMERAFDPWSPQDEQFYNEISYAVDTQDENLFENTIKKYNIKYIVLDEYLLNTLSKKQINYDSLQNFLANSPIVREKGKFNKVILYETTPDASWISELNPSTTKAVFPNYSFEKEDSMFSNFGNYITDSSNPSVINLFPSLYTEKSPEDLEFNVKNDANEYILTPKKAIPYNLAGYKLQIPSIFSTEFLVPVKVSFENGSLMLNPIYPQIKINGENIQIKEDPIVLTPTYLSNPTSVTFEDINQTIILGSKNSYSYLLNPAVNSIMLKDANGNSELVYLDTSTIPRLEHSLSVPASGKNSVSITIQKLDTSLSVKNVINSGKYQVNKSEEGPFTEPYSNETAKKTPQSIDLSATSGSIDLSFYLKDLYHEGTYIVLSKTKYESGLPIRFYVDNSIQNEAEAEAVFSKNITDSSMVVPKTNNFFQGYGFHFIVKSVGKEKAESAISSIEVYPFPDSFIRSLKLAANTSGDMKQTNPKSAIEFRKINSSTYLTYAGANKILVLSQSFDSGWAAYRLTQDNILGQLFPFIFGKRLKNHVLVNNWENGWNSGQGGEILIVYLPQYLEYLGFGLSGGTIVILSFLFLKHKSSVLNRRRQVDSENNF